MTEQRFEEIATAIAAKGEDHTKELLQLNPADASAALAKDGFSITEEELVEFGTKLTDLIKENNNAELGEGELEEVSGGCYKCAAVGTILGAAAGLGLTILLFY